MFNIITLFLLIFILLKLKADNKIITKTIIKTIIKIFLFLSILYIWCVILFLSVNRWNNKVTKYTLNKYFPTKNRLDTYILNIKNINNIKLPCIIKPIICSGTSKNVGLIKTKNDLINYIKDINQNETYIVQQFYKAKNEIGVLYEKIPFINDGNVVSIVSKKNNSNSWKPLKCGNINNEETTLCDDLTKTLYGSKFIEIIKNISNKIPGFNAGRYDIGFNSINDLQNGNFKIFELNGVMGFDLRSNIAGNENTSKYLKKISYIIRWIKIRLLIGFINIASLKANLFDAIKNIPSRIFYAIECSDCEHLYQPSPA